MRMKVPSNYRNFLKIWLLFFIISGLTTGCGSNISKNDGILKEARDTYAVAAAYESSANLEALSKAKKALENAENAETVEEIKHFAYLAKQQAQIAISIAERQKTERERLVGQKNSRIDKPILETQQQSVSINPQLEKQLNNWQQRQMGSLTITLNEVFENDHTDLSQTAQSDIKTLAAFLKQHPYFRISIEGHTDNAGIHTHNLGLSERRATSVKFALMNDGITSKRITVKGFGETRPIGSNRTQQGRQKNRRVEIIIFRGVN